MADLASTRVFGKLTVMHDAILRANAEIAGAATIGGKLTLNNGGYENHLQIDRGSHSWSITPTTANGGLLRFITKSGSGFEFTGGSLRGNGSGLTHLDAASLASGTVPNARLPTTATRWPSWSEVTGKPSTFTPSSHGHAASDISGLSNAATTSVATIRSGTTKANVGLGNVRNVASYSQSEADGRFVKLSDQSSHVEYSGDGGMIVRTANNNGSFIFQAQSSGEAARFTVAHDATELKGDSSGWKIGSDPVATEPYVDQQLGGKRDVSDTAFPRYDLASTSTTSTLNLAQRQVFRVDASSSRTLSFSNAPGSSRAMTVVVHITGSSGAITWPSSIEWVGGSAPELGDNWTDVVLCWNGSIWTGGVRGSA